MRRLVASDGCDILAPPARVFALLSDVAGYERWWPAALRVRVVAADEVEIRPPGSAFRCRLGESVPPLRLGVHYVAGPQRGQGIWTLAPLEGGRATRVHYAVDLEPHGVVARLLSHAMDFAAIHSRHMRPVLDGLAREAAGNVP